jgi:hypothetical protein
MTDTNNAPAAKAPAIVIKSVAFEATTVALQIGRTGEKAKFQGREVTIDLAKLPLESVAFALAYGLKQYIADGTAGSEDQKGYDLGIDQRLKKLAEADFARAAGEAKGPRTDTPEGRARKLAADAIRKHLKANNLTADAKAINEAAAKKAEAEPKWLKLAKSQLAAEQALQDDLLADGEDDIMAGLVANAAGNA